MILSFRIMEEILNVLDEANREDQKILGAQNSLIKRTNEVKDLINSGKKKDSKGRKLEELAVRMHKAVDIINSDPNKERKDNFGKQFEALELMEEIVSYADNIFELDIENKQNISPNKISKIKKDKDGKDVEVVSVADELFPHEGTAKQQFDKKILDKINAMIEGTGSLEDLIQFVRKGVQTKKMVHENKNLFGKETGQGSLEDDISTTLTGNTVHQNIENGVKKIVSPNKRVEEALKLMEEILAESNPETIQKVANKRAYDAGYHSQKQFNDGEVTPEGKKALKKFSQIKELIRKRENRTGDWVVKHSELADNSNKGWEDSKK